LQIICERVNGALTVF